MWQMFLKRESRFRWQPLRASAGSGALVFSAPLVPASGPPVAGRGPEALPAVSRKTCVPASPCGVSPAEAGSEHFPPLFSESYR